MSTAEISPIYNSAILKSLAAKNLKQQSTQVEGKKEGSGEVMRCSSYPEKLIETLDPQINTLWENFSKAAAEFPSHKCWGRRTIKAPEPFEWISYEQALKLSLEVGSGLASFGLTRYFFF